MRTALFSDVTQRRMAVFVDVLGQHIGSFFKRQVSSLGVKYLENGTDRYSRNVDTELLLYSG